MKKPMKITEDVQNYKGEWVALSGDLRRVVGHGATGKEAHRQANEAGEEHAFLLFIPEYVPDILIL
jgi:hypothetical protein